MDREEQIEAIDAAITAWRQGDCVIGEHWFVHRCMPGASVLSEVENPAAIEGDLIELLVAGFVVLSQTCDLVRSSNSRPYVEIAPLVEVKAGDLRSIEHGKRPRYVFVPGLESHQLVGDLDRVMTIEKSVVATWERVAGCNSDEHGRRFAQAVSRKHKRFAFPDDFNHLANPLQKRMQQKHGKQSDEGDALRALREIRVCASPDWGHDSVDIYFWFIRRDEVAAFAGKEWAEWLERWLQLVQPQGRFGSVDGVVASLDDMTARDYTESDQLDLDHLSQRT